MLKSIENKALGLFYRLSSLMSIDPNQDPIRPQKPFP
jgi:hypothetical protein